MSSPLSASSDKTFEDYLAIPTKASSYGVPVHPDWFPPHDVSYQSPLSHTFGDLYSSDLSQPYFIHSPLTPSTDSTFSISSPERSECGHDSSDSSGSDANSEAEVDRDLGSWSLRDDQAFHDRCVADHHLPWSQITNVAFFSSYTGDDAPYTPPCPQASLNAVDPAIIGAQYHYEMPPMLEDLPTGPRTSRQKASENIAVMFDGDSDVDAEGESEAGGSEDEYIPSPRMQPRQRRTYQYAYESSRFPSVPDGSASASFGPRRMEEMPRANSADGPEQVLLSPTTRSIQKREESESEDGVGEGENEEDCESDEGPSQS